MTKALELAKFGRESAPTGLVVGDNDAQTLSQKTFSDGPVFSGLNANGVPYLNASKVLSSSSTFVFDGTNVGLGIASPAATLHVNASGGGTIRASRSSVGGEYVQLDHDGTDGTLRVSGNNKLYLTTNGSTRVTVNGSGNVGIGTDPSTGSRLQVLGLTDFWNSTNTLLRVQHDGTRGRLQAYTGGATGNIGINSEGGNVGIGTDSPGAKLDVAGSLKSQGFTGTGSNISGGANQVTLDYLSGSGGARLLGWGPNTTTRGGIAIAVVSSDASLYTDAIRIDSSAVVGIGTTPNSNGKLSIYDTTVAKLFLTDSTLGTSYGGQIRGYGTTGAGGYLELGVVDANTYNSAIKVFNQATQISFYTNSGTNGSTAERLRISNTGYLTVNGGASFSGQVNINGNSLYFEKSGTRSWQLYASQSTGQAWLASGDGVGDFIIASNKVGIGTSTPSYTLHVAGTLYASGAIVGGSYASVGSIVANDPGAGYYSYNNRIGGGLAVVGNLYNAGNLYANRFTLNQGSSGTTISGAGSIAAGWYRFARSADGGANSFGARGGCTFYMYTTGGWSGPGQTKIDLFKDYSVNGNLTVDTKGNYYFTNWRIAMDSNYAYLEGYTPGVTFGGPNTFNTIVDSDGWDSGGWTLYSEPVTAGLTSPSSIIRASYINLNGRTLQRNINTTGNEPDDFVTVNGTSWGSAFDNPTIDLFTFPTPSVIYANLICEVEVYQTPWSNAGTGNIHTGYANYGNQGNIKNVSTMTVKANMPSAAHTNVGTLSWSGNTLRYTSNRASNYDHYSLKYTVRHQEIHNIQYFI